MAGPMQLLASERKKEAKEDFRVMFYFHFRFFPEKVKQNIDFKHSSASSFFYLHHFTRPAQLSIALLSCCLILLLDCAILKLG
mmetsp:Transcript_20655/g.40549  ORF Transcript_20655/g.40549 Transcript_20655/m.40549 type:complete len:83 (+) Transcript_20655:796-1044(+)